MFSSPSGDLFWSNTDTIVLAVTQDCDHKVGPRHSQVSSQLYLWLVIAVNNLTLIAYKRINLNINHPILA